jgi:prophage DNA circulation protein
MNDNIINYATSITDLTEALRTSSPTEAVRLLTNMASYQPGAIGIAQEANALLFRVANMASLSYALSEINPVSSNEAQSVLDTIIPLFDQLITDVSDAVMDETSAELKTLKSYVVSYLENLALTRPELMTVTYNTSLPASAIAYSLYRDAARADEIVFENNPVNPLFMPNSLMVLSS